MMALKKYRFLIFYALFIATGGLFIFYWIYSLMSDVNTVYRRPVFKRNILAAVYTFPFGMGLALMVLSPSLTLLSGSTFILTMMTATMAISISGFILTLFLPVRIYTYLDSLERSRRGAFDVLLVVLGMMAMGLTLPYLQWRADRALRREA